MDIQALKFVNIVECALCLHRKISSSTFIFRVLRYIYVLLEFAMLIALGLNRYFFQKKVHDNPAIFYFYIGITNSVVFMTFSVWKSKKYMHLLKYININHSQMKADQRYSRNLKRIWFILIAIVVVSLVMLIGKLFTARSRLFEHRNTFISFLTMMIIIRIRNRFHFEFHALFTILNVMTEQLANIRKSIDTYKVQRRGDVSEKEYLKSMKIYDKWYTSYTNLKEGSKLFNDVFGMQMTLMVASIVLYYIIFLYSFTSQSVKGETDLSVQWSIGYISSGLLLVNLLLLSLAAQRTQNEADILQQCLARLLMQSLASEDHYKSTKDLLRLVSSRPIRTQAFGSIKVDMSLLPTCVVFFTYYAVIALQFNNIV